MISVGQAAKKLGVSARRVRVLLTTGRLAGYKDAREVWKVNPFLIISPGKRGPRMKCKQPPKASGMAQRSEAIETAGERFGVCGKGDAREAV
ncbi:MAG: hypothetical protein WC029_06000 [Sulfuricella sp.]|jgi:hypothetical protein